MSTFGTVPTTSAVNVFKPCAGNTDSAVCADTNNRGATMIDNVVRLLLWAIGVVAVIVIIISGIKYATSDGDASKIKSAKDTILYAVVGLVVAILAYAIVRFVINQFS